MPVDRGAIDAQLREIGEGERWWEQREFRDLPYILRDDEHIRGLVNGRLLGVRRPRLRVASGWLIVATDQRLICLKQERVARKQVELAASEIAGVHHGTKLRAYQITIETLQRRYRIRIAKGDAFRFARALAILVPHPALLGPAAEVRPGTRLPGMATVAALPGVSSVVSMLSPRNPMEYASREHVRGLETAVDRLQEDVERLQQQVAFLENLLHKQADETRLTQTSPHS
ncbi:MAG: hypothetical protein JWM27_1321 [Gemmatimonadetes bacterium]|nr:hypothetical protein [Gemmatimonadota bacterium]